MKHSYDLPLNESDVAIDVIKGLGAQEPFEPLRRRARLVMTLVLSNSTASALMRARFMPDLQAPDSRWLTRPAAVLQRLEHLWPGQRTLFGWWMDDCR